MRGMAQSRSSFFLLLLLAAALVAGGCVGLAEDIATHLAKQDLKEINQDFKVFEADLAQFRSCLKQRGGVCEGDAQTAVPDSTQHHAGQSVKPTMPGSSSLLKSSIDTLAAGDPTRNAYEVLSHPVVTQAAALHHHLRGHDVGTVAGLTTETRARGADSTESTVTMDMKVANATHFHSRLLSSVGTTAWEALVEHCEPLLTKHKGQAGYGNLVADCRRATFVRGYLEAYLRNGQFLKVDVELVGVIQVIRTEGAKIEADIQTLRGDVTTLESKIATAEASAISALANQTSQVGASVTSLIDTVGTEVAKRYGAVGSDLATALAALAAKAGSLASSLTAQANTKVDTELQGLVTQLDEVLTKIDSKLMALRQKVSDVDGRLVQDIQHELGKADKTLSNVFRFSTTGFVSRDLQFQARLPTLEATIDPTAKRLVTVKDADSNNGILTGSTQLAGLGVAHDTSGVGTGANIGAEIVRVFLEALFDAHEGLPAVAAIGSNRPTGLSLGSESLPLFQAPMGHVDARDLDRMTRINNRVATQTRVVVGRIISGLGPFSLNNQPLEDLLVEVIATSVRKAAEKASWCWYACNLDVDAQKLKADAKTAAKDKVKDEEQKAEGAVKKEADKVRTWSHKEAEHVSVRLKLGR